MVKIYVMKTKVIFQLVISYIDHTMKKVSRYISPRPKIVRPIEPDEWLRAQNLLHGRGILQGGSPLPIFDRNIGMPPASGAFYDYMTAPTYDPLDVNNFGPGLSYDFVGLAQLADTMGLTNPTMWNLKIKNIWHQTMTAQHWMRPDIDLRKRLLLSLWKSIQLNLKYLETYIDQNQQYRSDMTESWRLYLIGVLRGITNYILANKKTFPILTLF